MKKLSIISVLISILLNSCEKKPTQPVTQQITESSSLFPISQNDENIQIPLDCEG